jgi:hypothetical protein
VGVAARGRGGDDDGRVSGRGEGLRGNREVSQVLILGGSRGVPEEGVRGGTWFPHGSEPEASDG